MPIDDQFKIPKDVMLPHVLEARVRLRCDPEKWNDYDISCIRAKCGADFAYVPLENVRRQCCNYRKQGLLGTLGGKNHGASKISSTPEWYAEYLRHPCWLAFREKVLEHWDYRCAVCYCDGRLEVHHRTYDRLDHLRPGSGERMTDCVPLCRDCHAAAKRRQDRAKKHQQGNLF